MDIVKITSNESLASVKELLRASKLPFDDLSPERAHVFGGFMNGDLVGCVALETYGHTALLRSLAVASQFRAQGLGDQLLTAAKLHATSMGIQNLILLTETASRFFERRHFIVIPRDAVPEAIQLSTQFTDICPSSAICMTMTLPLQST